MAEIVETDIGKVRQANFDLSDRMEEEGLTLSYDPEGDVLSIIIGEPREAITEPMVDDIMYRIDPETLKIVGFEIVQFQADFLYHNKVVRKMVKAAFPELLLETQQTIKVVEAEQRRKVESLLAGVI